MRTGNYLADGSYCLDLGVSSRRYDYDPSLSDAAACAACVGACTQRFVATFQHDYRGDKPARELIKLSTPRVDSGRVL